MCVACVSDAAAAEVKFTPGKKQNKFEVLMTKEELEEEQRWVWTPESSGIAVIGPSDWLMTGVLWEYCCNQITVLVCWLFA